MNNDNGTMVSERPRSATQSPRRGLTEEIQRAVADVDLDAWEQVRPSSDYFMDLRLLKALEISMADSCRFRFVIYRDASTKPVAIAVLCTFTIDIGILAEDAWSQWALSRLGKISRQLVDYRILFCGLPLSAGQSSLRFTPEADTAGVMNLLDQTLRRVARQDKSKIIVLKEFADHEMPPLKTLENLGYRKADSLPTHIVHLRSDSFDEYLRSLGQNSRHSIKRSMKKFAASGLQFMTTSDIETIERLMTPEVYELYESVFLRSKTKFEHLPLSFFTEMPRQLPDCCELTFAMEAERVRGFSIALHSGHDYCGLYMGFDESINSDTHLYFNLSLRGIEDAARHSATHVEIGQNSEEVKRIKFGALQSRRSIYVRGSNGIMNWIIGLLFKQLFPSRPVHGEVPTE